jgi:hypothetical protein
MKTDNSEMVSLRGNFNLLAIFNWVGVINCEKFHRNLNLSSQSPCGMDLVRAFRHKQHMIAPAAELSGVIFYFIQRP